MIHFLSTSHTQCDHEWQKIMWHEQCGHSIANNKCLKNEVLTDHEIIIIITVNHIGVMYM